MLLIQSSAGASYGLEDPWQHHGTCRHATHADCELILKGMLIEADNAAEGLLIAGFQVQQMIQELHFGMDHDTSSKTVSLPERHNQFHKPLLLLRLHAPGDGSESRL
jgi:hypothetical protein